MRKRLTKRCYRNNNSDIYFYLIIHNILFNNNLSSHLIINYLIINIRKNRKK